MSATTSTSDRTVARTRLLVGLEVHIELATRTKMFTRAPNLAHPANADAPPNTLVDPVSAALPGAMPVMNRRAVEMAMQVGLALECTIAERSVWDRKNYFYPDLPKGFQTSQYDEPLCHHGAMEIEGADGSRRRIGIIRAHLEEDTGKLGHELPGGGRYPGSLVDLNRAGTPLLEVVTAPDFDCAEDVVTFAQELRRVCRFLGVTEGIMQRGHMRFEPNINVIIESESGREHRTPVVEVKNLNSFRAVRGAIEHERERQVDAWLTDGLEMGPGAKSTRGWNDVQQVTVLQREKEDAHDYRYFPEPDLLPVIVDEAWREAIRATVPELPAARRSRYARSFGMDAVDAAALTDSPEICALFESSVEAHRTRENAGPESPGAGLAIGKLLLNAGAKRANERGVAIHELGISPVQVAAVVHLRETEQITAQSADTLFGLLCAESGEPLEIATRHGLVIVRDDAQMAAWIDAALEAHPQAADDVRAGKGAAVGRLVGHVMKLSRGQADAKDVNLRLRERLR